MALNDDDVREILRIIDESDLDELSHRDRGLLAARAQGHWPGRVRGRGARGCTLRRCPSPNTSGACTHAPRGVVGYATRPMGS